MDKDSVKTDFKIGDKVRFTNSKTDGVIVGIDRYPGRSASSVFYKVKMANGVMCAAKRVDIEPVQD